MSFKKITDLLMRREEENYSYVREHFAKPFKECPREELRDYYIALGKADMCSLIMKYIRHGVFQYGSFDEILDFVTSEKKENYSYVREHLAISFEECSREELRDYYIALGKADMCSEILRSYCYEFDFDALTIVCDRYCGAYSGGKYLAFALDHCQIPDAIDDGDIPCSQFWQSEEAKQMKVGRGVTVSEAIYNLWVQFFGELK